MQAWICNELSGPDALTWQDSPTPEPGPGEVRVAIKAASLNFPDLLIVQGKYQMKPRCRSCRAPNLRVWSKPWAKASST
jgi:NADPH2:quinone reductase